MGKLGTRKKDFEIAKKENITARLSHARADSKLKCVASGNSVFLQALEFGCKFGESTETQVKAQLYPKIKVMIRKAAASSYGKGAFGSGADWALQRQPISTRRGT